MLAILKIELRECARGWNVKSERRRAGMTLKGLVLSFHSLRFYRLLEDQVELDMGG